MTAAPPAEPSPGALGESLAAQLADLRGQVRTINTRLDQAGIRADLNLTARFEDLAQTVAGALEAAAPRGPAAPSWSSTTAGCPAPCAASPASACRTA